jgi:Pyridoxamine 5'-phosphate oxidase
MTERDTVKGRNIRRDPRVMLSIDDERPPFAFVLIEGTAVPTELMLSFCRGLLGSPSDTWEPSEPTPMEGAMQLRENFWFGLALGRLSPNKMLPTVEELDWGASGPTAREGQVF